MINFFRLKKYFEYQWKAKTKYYIHSPFVYQFYLNVLEGDDKNLFKDKYGKLLYHLTKYFNPQNILLIVEHDFISEYLISANPSVKIMSVRNPQIAQLNNSFPFDLVCCDGNYNKETILEYFHQCLSNMNENSIFILNNIYRNEESGDTWELIKEHSQITLAIDVFQFGICFFRKEKLAKENFVIRY